MTSGITPEQRSLERPITCRGQLLVEGRVPEMFFREMITGCTFHGLVEARTFGGVDDIQTWLELFTQKAAFKEKVMRVGIIRDAERSTADSAFQSVQHALQRAKLPVPSKMGGLEGNPLAVGVFILPNCQQSGMLEDLCLEAAAETERGGLGGVLPCVDAFFLCLAKLGQIPANTAKARFAGYALGRDVIDPQLGSAAQKGVIPWNAHAFDPLRAFLSLIAGTDA